MRKFGSIRSACKRRCWLGFEVGPGPAFHVYLVPKASIRSSSDLKEAKFVDLGGLRSFKGSQRYAIPPGVNPKDYQSVIIWCERFGVLISPADLTTAWRQGEAWAQSPFMPRIARAQVQSRSLIWRNARA